MYLGFGVPFLSVVYCTCHVLLKCFLFKYILLWFLTMYDISSPCAPLSFSRALSCIIERYLAIRASYRGAGRRNLVFFKHFSKIILDWRRQCRSGEIPFFFFFIAMKEGSLSYSSRLEVEDCWPDLRCSSLWSELYYLLLMPQKKYSPKNFHWTSRVGGNLTSLAFNGMLRLLVFWFDGYDLKKNIL